MKVLFILLPVLLTSCTTHYPTQPNYSEPVQRIQIQYPYQMPRMQPYYLKPYRTERIEPQQNRIIHIYHH